MLRSIGARTLSKLLKAMRLRRAVPKIPPKSSVLPRLPLNKSASLPTRSESTLPQLLIPLHFNSRISNTYKKPQGEGPTCNPKVLQLVTITSPLLRTRRNSRNPNPLYALLHNFGTPRGWGHALPSRTAIPGCHFPPCAGHGPRNTGHSPRLRWYRCTATRKVPESRMLVLVRHRETNPLQAVSKATRADIGFGIRRLPSPVARRSESAVRVVRARRPGSNVPNEAF